MQPAILYYSACENGLALPTAWPQPFYLLQCATFAPRVVTGMTKSKSQTFHSAELETSE